MHSSRDCKLALVLDSILAQSPPEDAASLQALRANLAPGTTSDFQDLDARDLAHLAGHLSILSNQLARHATTISAIDEISESGL